MEPIPTNNNKSSHNGLGCLAILVFINILSAWDCIGKDSSSDMISQKRSPEVGQQVSASEWIWAGPSVTGQLVRVQGGLPNANLGRYSTDAPVIGTPKRFKKQLPLVIDLMWLGITFGSLVLLFGLFQYCFYLRKNSHKIADHSPDTSLTAEGGKKTDGKEETFTNPMSPTVHETCNRLTASASGKIKTGLSLICISVLLFAICYLLHRYAGYEHPLDSQAMGGRATRPENRMSL